MKKQLPAWAALGIIAIVAGLLLGATNAITKDRIAEQALLAADAARQSVLPDAQQFVAQELAEGAPVDNCYAGMQGETLVGYTAQATVNGYGGQIEVTVGMNAEGIIQGISVGGPNFSETAGLGAKTKDAAFTNLFQGLDPANIYDVDSVTAATVSSMAVKTAVTTCADYIQSLLAPAGADTPAVEVDSYEETADGLLVKVSERGFGGNVTASVLFDANGSILSVTFEAPSETAGYGQRIIDEAAFAEQFAGQSGALTADTLSGATISSTAAIAAVQRASDFAAGGGTPAVPAVEVDSYEETADGLSVTVSERGFGGNVTATVLFDANGAIASVSIDAPSETAGIGSRVTDDATFLGQFAGQSGALTADAISGATISSNAAIAAVQRAADFSAAGGDAPAAPAVEVDSYEETADGLSVTVSERGFGGNVTATVLFDANGAIVSVTIDAASETAGIGSRVADDATFLGQYAGQSGALSADAISGATISSNAAINAIQRAADFAAARP